MKSIKILCFFAFIQGSTTGLFAQIEIKTQPLPFISKFIGLGMEYGLKPHISLEAEYYTSTQKPSSPTHYKAKMLWGGVKRYFDKDAKLTKFYLGGYSSYITDEFAFSSSSLNQTEQTTLFSLGATGGYKYLAIKQHLVLEAGLNLGKRFSYINGRLIDDTYFDKNQVKFFYYWDVSLRLLVGYRF